MKRILRIVLATLVVSLVTIAAEQVTTVRQIDFTNFTFAWTETESPEYTLVPWHCLTSTPTLRFRAVGGIHHVYLPSQDNYEREHAPLVSVDSVTYGDLDGDGAEEALVALNYSAGGTANWDYLYAFKLENARAKLIARMQTGSRAYGGLVRAFVREGLLIADFADSERLVGDCCSEGYIRVRYRWQDGAFVEEGDRERGKIDLHEGPPRPSFRNYRVKKIYHGDPATPIITQEFRG